MKGLAIPSFLVAGTVKEFQGLLRKALDIVAKTIIDRSRDLKKRRWLASSSHSSTHLARKPVGAGGYRAPMAQWPQRQSLPNRLG